MPRPRFRPSGLQSPWYHTPAPSGTVHSRPQRKCSQHTCEVVNPGTVFIAGAQADGAPIRSQYHTMQMRALKGLPWTDKFSHPQMICVSCLLPSHWVP